MPRLIDWLVDAVFYLYPTAQAAEGGDPFGGTGFFAGTSDQEMHKIYAVTSSHVVRAAMGNSPVVRVNRTDGGFDVLPFTAEDWIHHPDGDDIAVCPIDFDTAFRLNLYAPRAILDKFWFVDAQDIAEWNVGPGDDVFFVGRFAIHEGVLQNTPTARFGNIAMMPIEPILNPFTGIRQESFLVEARSLSGYSGSPVFIYIGPGSFRGPGLPIDAVTTTFALIGVDWGHLANLNQVLGADGKPFPDKGFVRQNSGMMGVVPAWKLRELLYEDELVAMRKRDEENWGGERTAARLRDVSEMLAEEESATDQKDPER